MPGGLLQRLRRFLLPALGLLACGVILVLLQQLSSGIDYHATITVLRGLPLSVLGWSVLATVISYAALIGRDATLLPLAGTRVAPVPLLLGAACGSALGNAVGTGALTGGAVRYRVYGSVGVRPEQIAQLMLLITVSFTAGLVVLTAVSGVVAAPAIAAMLHLPEAAVRLPSVAILVASGIGLLFCRAGGPPLRIGRLRIARLSRRAALAQLFLVGIDLLGAGLALWVLLPDGRTGLVEFMAIFTAAITLGVISHVPGGLGVFEAVVVFALRDSVSPDQAIAALLAYRAIYFLLPLLLSGILVAAFELRAVSGRLAPQYGERVRRAVDQLAPPFLGVITFAIGAMLLVSGATPSFRQRLDLLSMAAPLWLVEASHFLGSLVGVVLLFVARGLFHRLDGAWWLAMVLTSVSLVLSLAKGLAFGEATLLLCLLLTLWGVRPRFNRPASLLQHPLTPGWLMAIATVTIVAVWSMLFAFRDTAYTHDLWWQFAFDARAPRALRATVAAAAFATGLALWVLLRGASARAVPPSAQDLLDAAQIIRTQERSSALLALMGDKSFLFSASRRAFLMYACRGRSWIALYDPVGPREEWAELIWRFVELADSQDGRVAFYQVRPENLPLYLDAGLRLIKLGEEAVIRLDDFTLQGGQRSHLRYALRRGERDGLTFELVPEAAVPEIAPMLARISDAWLKTQQTREKGFSVAAFGPAYLAAQSVALVRQHGAPVAFVTVMATGHGGEATIGIMRHTPDASAYAMEFLFTRLALHLKEHGFHALSLGMAPLAGLAPTPLASSWHHLASLLWQHGGRLYNFQGLRAFKNKFAPSWEPRYLAASGTIGPYLALADVTMLTGAGRP
ncbi:putative membrane protein [Rhodovastum atsumiense]|uniref:Bifunctional lysylphosphatidylglycerol flippase/synthetase MprF n=2 Tax=Rhodovastum atsumiense TaxID=504468 RepID=A0A5M6IXG7_9PROT|nr:bifunctional lysylphosphatidylglycerol flippase/synthetase MprF [Rhodovastum atsumiense]CAH2601087.1 putative membrane protein [Rhodovastum atsumiense]